MQKRTHLICNANHYDVQPSSPIVEAQEKDIPEIGSGPSINAEADQIDENGYSWLMHEGKQWYRTNSESHWFEFEGQNAPGGGGSIGAEGTAEYESLTG